MDISKLTGADITAIAKIAGIDAKQVEGLITMATSQKMPKAEAVFKAGVGKLDKKNKRAFTFVEEAKGSFFFVDMAFPLLKKDLQPKIKEVEKQLKKANDQDKAGLEAYKAFLDGLFDRVKKKKMSGTYGNMKFSNNEDGKCFMYPVGKVQGARKASLHEVVNPLNLTSKTGHTICFLDPKEAPKTDETDEETTDTGEENTGDETGDTTSDSAPETAGESRQYKRLNNAFDKVKGKLAEWKGEEDSKKKINKVKPLLKNVEKLMEHVEEFIGKDDTSDTDKTAATEMKGKLETYKASLSQMNSTIDKKKGEATVKGMDDLFAKIKAEADKIKGDHGDELAGLGGSEDLTSILDDILA